MQLLIFLAFITIGSVFGEIYIRLTEVDADINLPVAQVIKFNEYKLLGGGGSGTIVLVKYDTDLFKIDLVLKLVSKKNSLAEVEKEYLILQVLKGQAAGLEPAAIIRSYGYGSYSGDDEGSVLVLQHVRSPHLNNLGFDFNASTKEVLSTGLDLINIMEVAHNEGIMHMDIKSQNLLYAEQEQRLGVVVIDWGSAEMIGRRNTGRSCSTIAFMSPNVNEGGEHGPDDDLRSIMYTLGKAGFKGSLPWELTSLFNVFSVLFGTETNKKKVEFEAGLEIQNLDPLLKQALIGIRTYLQSPSSRAPKQINYQPIREAFEDALSKVPTSKVETWWSYILGFFTRMRSEKKSN